jgi:hypothetical protein
MKCGGSDISEQIFYGGCKHFLMMEGGAYILLNYLVSCDIQKTAVIK